MPHIDGNLNNGLSRNRQHRQKPSPEASRKARLCFSCGRPLASNTGRRFCSGPCRDWFDAGYPPYTEPDQTATYSLPVDQDGFDIPCAACGTVFPSKGLRCCSTECERRYREQQDNRAVLTEVGQQPAPKRQCAECGATIPTWRNGRRVRSGTQFCSKACSKAAERRARVADNGVRLGSCPPGAFVADNVQEAPIKQTSKSASEFPSPAAAGLSARR